MTRLVHAIVMDARRTDVRRLKVCLDAVEGLRATLRLVAGDASALDRLGSLRADVLFIDEDLPRITGVEAIRALRSAGERRAIIATTRVDCGYLAADLVRAGADGYLAKRDLRPEVVGRVLERAMMTARARRRRDRAQRSAAQQIVEAQTTR